MSLINQGGKLLVRDGKLATGESCCCGAQCELCATGQLPDTVTLTFAGFDNSSPGYDLISVSISSCYGSGATGRVTSPGGDPVADAGPITSLQVTDGGSGYAKLGRVAPTLTVAGVEGSGATFTPTLTKLQDSCGVDYWSISAVSVAGGAGYSQETTITISDGDTQEDGAGATIVMGREQPSLSVSGDADVVFSYVENGNDTWGIESATVNDGGSAYADGPLTVILGQKTYVQSAAALIGYTGRVEPEVDLFVWWWDQYMVGSGAVLTPTLEYATDLDARGYWRIASISITEGGTNYSSGHFIRGGSLGGQFVGQITSVGTSGEITGVEITDGGVFYDSNGVLESVEIQYGYGGEYYKVDGIPQSVAVHSGGKYYREDPEATPYIADITVDLAQTWPSAGTGAEIQATVDDDPQSEFFGQVTGLSVSSGGDNYLAYQSSRDCRALYEGRQVVLKRNQLIPNTPEDRYQMALHGIGGVFGTVNGHPISCNWTSYCPAPSPDHRFEWEQFELAYGGQGDLWIYAQRRFQHDIINAPYLLNNFTPGIPSQFISVDDCDQLTFQGNPAQFVIGGGTITVTPGGEYEPPDCKQYSCDLLANTKITMTWDGQTFEFLPDADPNSGDPYILLCYGIAEPNYNNIPTEGARVNFGAFADRVTDGWVYSITTSGANSRIRLIKTADDCSLEWDCVIHTTKYPAGPYPDFSLAEGHAWRTVRIPVDEDGYPEGDAVVRRSGPLNGYPSLEVPTSQLTIRFDKVLP